MIDTSSIDQFLAESLRSLRADCAACWPTAQGQDWTSRDALTAIWSRIEFHGIPVLLHDCAALLTDWPAKMLERIAEEARLIGLWELTHGAAVGKLLAKLETAGIEAVLMKGTALAYSIYDEPAARRRGDSDLLIRPDDRDDARAVLTEAGWYRNDDPHGITFQEGWLHDAAGHFVHAVDLHWEPSDRAVLQKVLSLEDFFAHKCALPRMGKGAFRADHPLTIIHETINQKWHVAHGYWTENGQVKGARRLTWSVDFDLLASELTDSDWARLTTLCAERGVGPLVAEALHGAQSDLGTPLPEGVLAALKAKPTHSDIAAFFATTDNLTEFWLNLRSARSWGDRFRMVRDRGFPPRGYLIEKYPNNSGWPTPLLQGRLLVETAGRILRRAVSQ